METNKVPEDILWWALGDVLMASKQDKKQESVKTEEVAEEGSVNPKLLKVNFKRVG